MDHIYLMLQAMPDALHSGERRLLAIWPLRMLSWISKSQRFDIRSLPGNESEKFKEIILRSLQLCAAAKQSFHVSYIASVMDEAMKLCIDQRRKLVTELHPLMFKKQNEQGLSGLISFWTPWMTRALNRDTEVQGIAQAKHERAERRSCLYALRRVSSNHVTLDELHEAILNLKLVQNGEAFLKIAPAPAELMSTSSEVPTQENIDQSKLSILRQSSVRRAGSNLGRRSSRKGTNQTEEEELKEVDVLATAAKGSMSAELLTTRISQLAVQAKDLRAERDDLLNHLAMITSHQETGQEAVEKSTVVTI